MKNYANFKFNIVEEDDEDLIDNTSGADIMGLCLGFVAVWLVIGLCFFLEFVK